MKEQLIEFETAKLAKEKGFDWRCLYYYYNGGHLTWDSSNLNQNDFDKHISAPTQSLLQKWLREEHKINVEAGLSSTRDSHLVIVFEHKTGNYNRIKEYFNTYEKALEAGLIEALKLI